MVSLNRGNVIDRSSAAASSLSIHKKNIPLHHHSNKSGKSTERELTKDRDENVSIFERDLTDNLSHLNMTKDSTSNNNTLKSKLNETPLGNVSLISKMKEIESKFEYKDILADYESQLNNQHFHFRDTTTGTSNLNNNWKNYNYKDNIKQAE